MTQIFHATEGTEITKWAEYPFNICATWMVSNLSWEALNKSILDLSEYGTSDLIRGSLRWG